MYLPAAFEVHRAIYGADAEIDDERREIWRLPDLLTSKYMVKKPLDRSIIFAPVLAATLPNNYADFLESILAGTRRLFDEPFDERRAPHAVSRARLELHWGLDLRSRPVHAMSILCGLAEIVARHHWFRPRQVAPLYDVATRILRLDVANAVRYRRRLTKTPNRISERPPCGGLSVLWASKMRSPAPTG
jgi:hypothetical protein